MESSTEHAAERRPSTLIIQGDDLGDYTTWYRWWLDEPDTSPVVWRVDRSAAAELLDEFALALPIRRLRESTRDMVERALAGALCDPERELDLMTRLGRRLLPFDLGGELLARSRDDREVHVRITPAPSTARVPWELLGVPGLVRPDGRAPRLVELAAVVADVPAGFHAGRAVARPDPGVTDAGGVLRVIDPDARGEAGRLFTDEQYGRLAVDGERFPPGAVVSAADLGAALRRRPAVDAFLFVGHVTGSSRSGATSLQLSPTSSDDPGDSANGRLSASELVLGTIGTADHEGVAGAELWPMPARVGFVACDSGGDSGRQEPFGLLVAALNAGAVFAVGTRWVLPADRAFRLDDELEPGDPEPLADLARLVERVLTASDPAVAMRAELRARLVAWEKVDADEPAARRAAASPLVWAALTAVVAPPRAVELADD